MSLRVGTRSSALALAQARRVADRLPDAELVPMTTRGDRTPGAGEDKARWVADLEEALLAGDVDLAVHSAKDVPGELPDGLALVAVPERVDPRDALCGALGLDDLHRGARVGTSSLRRAAQLRAAREDLEVVELRGNVDTRLRRLAEGDFDALVIAMAGLERLGRAKEAGGVLGPDVMVPAAGQGTLAVEARADDLALRDELVKLSDPEGLACLLAERAVVAELDATCRTPVGAHAQLHPDGIDLRVFVGLPDGSEWIRDRIVGPEDDPAAVGREAARRVRAAGGGDLLARADAAAA